MRTLARRIHSIAARVRVVRFRARVRYAALRVGASVRLDVDPSVDLEGVPEVYVLSGTSNVVAIDAGVVIGTGCRVELRGGTLALGEGTNVRHGTRLNITGDLRIGARAVISTGVHIHCAELVSVDDWTIIGEYTTIADSNHLRTGEGVPVHHSVSTAPVHIGRNIWIGAKVTVAKGVTIGDQAFVGANAVVTEDVEPWWLVAGNPATPVRRLDPRS